jgi:hypothetical protein
MGSILPLTLSAWVIEDVVCYKGLKEPRADLTPFSTFLKDFFPG